MHAASDELAGERMLGIAADVSTEEGTEKYAAAIEGLGRVDGLFANAGIAEPVRASPTRRSMHSIGSWP